MHRYLTLVKFNFKKFNKKKWIEINIYNKN